MVAERSFSRNRSDLKHAIGDDDEVPGAPTPQELFRESPPPTTVQPLTMELVDAMTNVHNEGFGSKHCCLCCPVADTDGRIQRFYAKHPERLPMCGVALGNDGKPLGFVQLAIYPMNDKDGLHNTQPGEAYVEMISVAAAARGKGIGKLLLGWAEAKARERASTVLTLSVLHGNPAIRLYERLGFEAKEVDGCEQCIGGCVVCCLFGRPYGVCDPHWGSVDMKKSLTPGTL